jgi:sodium pump decarboxylase gamma subunit
MFNTLMQGLVLLIAGMGIVYIFLALMVWVMNLFARIIPRFNHILPDDEPKKKTRKPAPQPHAAAHTAAAVSHDAACTEIKSALPGAVLRVSVKAGDHVAKDDELIVLDVMKMETPVRADKGGVIAAIKVSVGEKVNTGDVLALIA